MIQKILIRLATLFIILSAVFIMLHAAPGGPFDDEKALSPEIKNNLYEIYGLTPRGDHSFITWVAKDYISYLKILFSGQLGPSLKYRDRDVADILASSFMPTLLLVGLSSLIIFALSLILSFSYFLIKGRFHRFYSHFIHTTASLSLSLPTYVTAIFLVTLFSNILGLLPPGLFNGPEFIILPVIALSLSPTFLLTTITIEGLKTELSKPYTQTARAKGLSALKIMSRHAFSNYKNTHFTMLSHIFLQLIAGTFIVETLFSIPGIGRHFVTSIIDRDYYLVMGTTFLYALIVILVTGFMEYYQERLHD